MSEDVTNATYETSEVVTPTAVEAIEAAQINQQIATAKRYPRDIGKVAKKIEAMVCLDEETAAACFYVLPRGGKNIEGPSVRMAEIAITCYGNIRAATRIVEEVLDGPTPHVKVQAVAHDLESNVAVCLEKRRRITKKHNKPAPDEDDLNLAVNSCTALAYRDAAFKVIPGVMIKSAMRMAKVTATGNAKPLKDRVAKCLAWYAKIGIPFDRVLAVVGKAAEEDVDQDDLITLTGIKNALTDGASKIEEVFPPIKKDTGKKGVEAVREAVSKAKPDAEPTKDGTLL